MSTEPETSADSVTTSATASAASTAPPPPRRRWLWRVLVRLLAVAWGLLLAVLMLEIFMRVGFDALPSGTQDAVQHVRRVPWDDEHILPVLPLIGSSEFQARLPPGLDDYLVHWGDAKFTFDTLGLWERQEGFRTGEPQWPMHVVAVGDSFTFCWTAVDDCWVQQLRTRYGWNVMNLGIPGTGSTSHLAVLKAYAPPMEPAVVVWQWYGNDLKDDYDHARMQGAPGGLAEPPAPDPPPNFGKLADYSAVYRVIRDWLHDREHPRDETGFYPAINGRTVSLTDQLQTHLLAWDSVAYGWPTTLNALAEAQTVVEDEIGGALVVVLIPTKEEAYAAADGVADMLGAEYLDALAESRRMLISECAARGWRCLDLTPAFQQALAGGATVYNAYDFHLDASGNAILAQTLGEYLLAEGLLDPASAD